MSKLQRPGENPHRPGIYIERGPRGGETPNARRVNIEPGDNPLPPTQKSGRTWKRIGPPKRRK
ncbi:MAG: YjzC family protein [Deinococcota bacterium]